MATALGQPPPSAPPAPSAPSSASPPDGGAPPAPEAVGARHRRLSDTGVVAMAALVAYLGFSLWMRFHLNYIIGDSLARTANAVYVIGGRDPHLAAIGFYWPPLPSLAQVPLIPLLQPFGLTELAGPMVSALSMAGTVAVVGALGRRLGVPRFVNLVVSVLFASCPLMIFYGANGMSEASFLLFVALAFHGYVGWARTGRTAALATTALALAGAELVRYEALLLIAVLALCGGVHLKRLGRSLTGAVALALPGVFAFVYLLVLQLILVRDPFYFLKVGQGAAPKPQELLRYVPDAQHHPFSAVTWSLSRTLAFSPAIVLLGLLLLRPLMHARARRPLTREALALGGAWLAYPALNAVLVLGGLSFGNSRYFVICTLMGTIAALWLTPVEHDGPVALGGGRLEAVYPKVASAGLAIALVALTTVVTTVAQTRPSFTKVEHEDVVFRAMVNRPYPKDRAESAVYDWSAWRRLADVVDPRLTGSTRLLADVTYCFPLAVFSKRVDHMIVTNDTDFEAAVADPIGRFQYVLVPRAGVEAASRIRDVVSPIVTGAPQSWRSLGDYDKVTLFEYVGPPP